MSWDIHANSFNASQSQLLESTWNNILCYGTTTQEFPAQQGPFRYTPFQIQTFDDTWIENHGKQQWQDISSGPNNTQAFFSTSIYSYFHHPPTNY